MYQLEINLTKIALITLAKSLWDTRKIINHMRKFFEEEQERGKDEWYKEVTEIVLRDSISLSEKLPKKFKPQLEEEIVFVGEELFCWIKFLSRRLNLNFTFAEVTYLSPFGTIDESQIIQKSWHKDGRLWLENCENKTGYVCLNFIHFLFCQKQFIFESRYKMIGSAKKAISFNVSKKAGKKFEWEVKRELKQLQNEDDIVCFLLITWINNHYQCILSNNINGDCRIISTPTAPFTPASLEVCKSVLTMSCSLGSTHLFRYFLSRWPFVVDHDDVCDECVSLCQRFQEEPDLTDYEKTKNVEILFALMNQMSDPRKQVFLEKHYPEILDMTITCWLYQKFFLKIFYAVLPKINSDSKWRKMLDIVTMQDMNDDLTRVCPMKKDKYRQIMKAVWAEARYKMSAHGHRDIIPLLTNFFLYTYNFQSLRIVINFTEPPGIDAILSRIFFWITQEKFHLIDRFMKEGLRTEECEIFKGKIKDEVFHRLIKEGHFKSLDKFFPWLGKYGVSLTKNDIDGMEAVKSMITAQKIESADNFLRWFYGSEDEITAVKNYFRKEEHSRYFTFRIFNSGYNAPDFEKNQAEKFLNLFLFSSQEEIKNFKLNVLLKDENCVLQFALMCDNKGRKIERTYRADFFPIQKVIEFCELPKEKIKELKRNCREYLEQLLDLCTPRCDTFCVMYYLIKWLYRRLPRRHMAIQKYMKTHTGLMLCNRMLNLDKILDKNLKQIILRFYNKLVKHCGRIPQIKKFLEDMNGEKFTEADKEKLSSMFRKLEKGENLIFLDVLCFGIIEEHPKPNDEFDEDRYYWSEPEIDEEESSDEED